MIEDGEITLTKFALIGAAMTAGVALTASTAFAATYNYQFQPAVAGPTVSSVTGASDTSPNAASNPDIFTITAGYVIGVNPVSAQLTQNTNGLGVTHPGDSDPGHIDGSPLLTGEFITVSFDTAVTLDSFTLQDFENGPFGNDDFALLVTTTSGTTLSFGTQNYNLLDIDDVTSFTILAYGAPLLDGRGGNDEFTFKGFQISTVPLPATGGLLLGALGAMAYLRRRRAA